MPRPSYPLFEHLTRLDSVVAAALRPRVPRRAGRSTSRSVERALTPRTRARARRQPEQSDRLVRHARRARSARGALRARATSRSSPTKCSPTTSSSRARRRGAGRALSRARRAGVHARRAVEVHRPAAGEARVDRGRPARTRSSARRSRGSSSICDTYLVGLDAGAARRRRPAASAAPPSARRFAARVVGQLSVRCSAAVAARAVVPRAARRRRLVRGAAGAVARIRGGSRARPAERRRRARASGLLLRLSARVVPRRQPAAARGRCSRDGVVARPAALRLQRRVRHDVRRSGTAPRGPAHPAVLVPVDARAGASARSAMSRRSPRGWPAPASACCSCCRSTRWRPASSRRTRRSARWRSIRSSSACRRCPSSQALGGEAALPPDDRERARRRARARRAIDYAAVRRLKQRALRARVRALSRARVAARHRARRARCRRSPASRRGGSRTTPVSRASTRASRSGRGPSGRRRCSAANRPRSIGRAASWRDDVLFHQYLQWIADTQWQARATATRTASQLFGDLPFMVDGDSADVWARQHQFRSTCRSARRPTPSARPGRTGGCRSTTGTVARGRGFPLAARARAPQRRPVRRLPRRSPRRLLSHLRPAAATAASAFFTPADEPAQLALGETRARASSASAGAEIIAEDLGTVPDFVRASLARLGVPGFRVFRWERHWHTDGPAVPRSRRSTRRVSVATSGTHDTEPLIDWWEHASEDERRKVSASADRFSASPAARISRSAPFDPRVRDVLLETLFASGSDLLLLPDAGRLRLARSHQRAGDRRRRQLDVPPAVAGRSARRRPRSARAARPAARLVRASTDEANAQDRRRQRSQRRSSLRSLRSVCGYAVSHGCDVLRPAGGRRFRQRLARQLLVAVRGVVARTTRR